MYIDYQILAHSLATTTEHNIFTRNSYRRPKKAIKFRVILRLCRFIVQRHHLKLIHCNAGD